MTPVGGVYESFSCGVESIFIKVLKEARVWHFCCKSWKGQVLETRRPRPGVKGLQAECSRPGGRHRALLPGRWAVSPWSWRGHGPLLCVQWRQQSRRMCVGDGSQEAGRCGDTDLSLEKHQSVGEDTQGLRARGTARRSHPVGHNVSLFQVTSLSK